MADCSKTEVFLAEWRRMCQCIFGRSYESDSCPLYAECQCDGVLLGFSDSDTLKRMQLLVQKWSDEHPAPKPKTYADDFFERFPNNTILTRFPKDFSWMNSLCRDVYFGGVDCRPGRDCKSCWEEPYQEQDGKGVIDNG